MPNDVSSIPGSTFTAYEPDADSWVSHSWPSPIDTSPAASTARVPNRATRRLASHVDVTRTVSVAGSSPSPARSAEKCSTFCM